MEISSHLNEIKIFYLYHLFLFLLILIVKFVISISFYNNFMKLEVNQAHLTFVFFFFLYTKLNCKIRHIGMLANSWLLPKD